MGSPEKATLFISDLHLSPHLPHLTAIFLKFLKQASRSAEALYILGDFFEVWLGDDIEDAFTQSICQALKAFSKKVPVYIMPGNRDFLLGKYFAHQSGATLLKDPTVITLYGVRTLLCHGDLFCTADKSYQKWRRVMHLSWLQKIFLTLPAAWRKKIGIYLRKQSQRYVSQLSFPVMDVVPSTVKMMLQHYEATRVIHGHTHQPAIHYMRGDNGYHCRYVLSDWYGYGHVLKVQAQKPPYLNQC